MGTQGTEIAITGQSSLNNLTITEAINLGGILAKSGFFSDIREASQAITKIIAGKELGFGPVYSMTKIYIVKGKIAVSAETLGAMVKRSGRYDYAVKKLDDEECILFFTDNGKEAYTSKFTMGDAKRAGIISPGSGWEKWPRAMLMSKALSQGARIVCPHVIAGVYTPEDMGLEAESEGEYKQPEVIVGPTIQNQKEPEKQASDSGVGPVIEMCTDAQRKKIFASGKQMNYSEADIKKIINLRFKVEHTTDLTKADASELIEAIAAGKNVTESGEWIP
jgi:hypothetical protein